MSLVGVLEPSVAAVRRWWAARSRPTGAENARRMRERGETLDRIVLRDAVGFYDRLRGERLRDDRGRFNGAYGWRDVRVLLAPFPSSGS